MYLHNSVDCCGIYELTYVEDTNSTDIEEDFKEAFAGRLGNLPAFAFFSTTLGKNGSVIAALIKKHKLGEVVKLDTRKNLNSGNMLTMWCWGLDKAAIKKYCK